MSLKNDLLLRAAHGEFVERVPIWLMRQAGRVLPEYRRVREKAGDFITLVKTPEWAAEVTIQPVDILGVDAAILFSDILVIPEAMGLPYEMIEQKGPYFPQTIKLESDIKRLRIADADEDLDYVLEAIRLTKKGLDNRVPLIGFAGAPFTIFCYMVEGKGSKTFSEAKKMIYTQPELAHTLLTKITESTINYLLAQIREGVDLVQIFDSWAGILDQNTYHEFSLQYLKRIAEAILPTQTPLTIFAKDAYFALKYFKNFPCSVIGLDWGIPRFGVREWIGFDKTIQGNLDPCALYGDFQSIRKNVKEMIHEFGVYKYIANLGHGLYPDTRPDHIRCFIEAVKEYSS